MRRLPVLALVGALLSAVALSPAAAQQATTTAPGAGGRPLEVTADNGIEWNKEQKTYTARGNAQVKRGTFTVRGAVLTAHYRDKDDGKSEIYRVEATGGVVLNNGGDVARGDRAVYDVDRKVLTLTGKDLSYVSSGTRITASDSLEYWEVQRTAVARGNAVAAREDETVKADMMVGYFEDRPRADDPGRTRRELARVDAIGNVEIANKENVARAARATYDPETKEAQLTGGVQIVRGADRLNGERAEVNMRTGVYRLLPGTATPGAPGSGRVTGTITPDGPPPGGKR
ncbi:MAG: LptA/OstA family protein [Reyranellaceae bacterium]